MSVISRGRMLFAKSSKTILSIFGVLVLLLNILARGYTIYDQYHTRQEMQNWVHVKAIVSKTMVYAEDGKKISYIPQLYLTYDYAGHTFIDVALKSKLPVLIPSQYGVVDAGAAADRLYPVGGHVNAMVDLDHPDAVRLVRDRDQPIDKLDIFIVLACSVSVLAIISGQLNKRNETIENHFG